MLSADSFEHLNKLVRTRNAVSVCSVSGDIFGGRDGIAFEVGGKRFDPEQLGRKSSTPHRASDSRKCFENEGKYVRD